MQKHSEHPFRRSLALLVLIFLGLLFFGSYLAVERLLGEEMPTLTVALCFLGGYLLLALCTFLYFLVKDMRQNGQRNQTVALTAKIYNMFKYVIDLPYAIADESGRVRVINQALQELIGARDPFFRGTVADICSGSTLRNILNMSNRSEETPSELGRALPVKDPADILRENSVLLKNGRRYTARAYQLDLETQFNYLITFTDVTELCDLMDKTKRDLPVIAYIDVDNLEELAQYTRANYRDISRRVDDALIQWAANMQGMLREYERDRYILIFSQEKLLECEENKFSDLMDVIRDIRLGEYGIPVTLSVGISVADATMEERAQDAQTALDMALQRGGDQVAVRRRDGIHYYGGQTRTFQRRTKVQSRMVASYLLSKISEADNLLIMGHQKPDFDSIGSCLGIAQLGLLAGVRTKIIMDLDSPNFQIATKRLLATEAYSDMFISGHEGLDLVRPGTLLVIADANNFGIIESPELAQSVRRISGKIAIIDHHRQTGEYDFEPLMTYIEPGASSASELVTEMLEQSESGDERASLVGDEVASVILSGIVLDTGNFIHNTGLRTLDAARYLYGKGANAEYVHSFFNVDYEDYVRERSFSGCMLLQDDTVGLTWSHGTGCAANDRIAAAKEAEKLLNVKGVSAAFSLVHIDDVIHISGRSDGTVNVQLILERLGGGGRFDSAGAALSGVTIEDAKADLEKAVQAYFAELDKSND
ncbi:MAG: DHH family phosphoesterase [Clostridia bacterium]|nr:DHH family phosphoesterase [Clostridia bacterium]